MQSRPLTLIAAAALALAVSSAARADGAAPAGNPPPAAATGFNANRFVWGGLGIYDLSVSACEDGFCASASSAYFGLNGGGALGLVPLASGLELNGWADLSIVFGSGATVFPINVGAGVTYDKLPVVLFGGAALEFAVPTSGSTSVGVDFKLMGLYPLATVMKNLAVQAQFNLAFLSNSLTIWALTAGIGYSF